MRASPVNVRGHADLRGFKSELVEDRYMVQQAVTSPCLAEATPRTQNVLAQRQSEAHGDSKLYNTVVEVPARLNSTQLVTVPFS